MRKWTTRLLVGVAALISLSVCLAGTASASIWTRQAGTTADDEATGIATDLSGNVYVCGNTAGGLDGNTNACKKDFFVVKYDTSGEKLWTRQMGTTEDDIANGLVTDGNGNAYVTGTTSGGLDGNTYGGYGGDIFLVKYDTNGNKLWTRQTGTTFYDYGNGVTTDGSGNAYVCGSSNSAITVIKYDTSGNTLWTKMTNYGMPYGIATDAIGNVYVAGDTGVGLDGNTNAGYYDIFVIKYDSNGNMQWTRQMGTAEYDWVEGVSVDGNGNVYVAGETLGGLGGNMNAGYTDYFVVKYDTNGNRLWTRQSGTTGYDHAYGVATDGSGNVYVAADEDGSYVLKYDTNGNRLWTRQIWGAIPLVAVCVASSGNVCVAGNTCFGLDGNTYEGLEDLFVMKLGSGFPNANITAPTNNAYINSTPYAITGTATDNGGTGIEKVEVSTDLGYSWDLASDTSGNGSWATWSYNWTPLPLPYIIRFRVTDNAGDVETPGADIPVEVDYTAPTTVIATPKDGAFIEGTSCNITGTASDDGPGMPTWVKKVEVSINGGAWTAATGTTSWSYSWTLTADGNYTIKSRATDNAGNVETPGTGVIVTVDKTAPTSAITAPVGGAIIKGTSCSIAGTAADGAGSGVQKVEVSTNGGSTWIAATGTTSWSYTWTLPADGNYAIKSRATDNAGHVETPGAGVSATVDNTAPTSSRTAPSGDMAITVASYTITGTSSDGTGTGVQKVEVSTDGGSTWNVATGTTSWSYIWAVPAAGSFNIRSRATDAAGNIETPGMGVTVTKGHKLIIVATPAEGGSVTLDPPGNNGWYPVGAGVLLTETPASGYAFLGWSGAVTGKFNTAFVTMNSDKTVKANFKNVALSMNPSYSQDGSRVTLSATFNVNGLPASGKSIAFFEKTGTNAPVAKGSATTNASGVATLTFTSSAGAHSAYAKYTPPSVVPIDQPNGAVGTNNAPGIVSPDLAYFTKKVSVYEPANHEVVDNPTPMLSYEGPDGTESFHVQVATSSTFGAAAVVDEEDTSERNFFPAVSLLPGKTYYWRVQATIPNGRSMYSDTRSMVYKILTQLEWVSIVKDRYNVTVSAKLSDAYEGSGLPIAGKPVGIYEGAVLRASGTTLTDGTVTKTLTFTMGTHQNLWFKFNGDAAYSPSSSGENGTNIDKVTLASPANGEVVTTATPTLSWQEYYIATSYHVQVATATTFGPTTILQEKDITAPTTNFTLTNPLLVGKTYYWRVQATNPEGKSIYSDYRRVVYKYGTVLMLESLGKTGSVIKLKATLTRFDNGSPIPGRTLTFVEDTGGNGVYVSKGTAVTGGASSPTPGVAIKSWTTTAAAHSAMVKFLGDAMYAPTRTDEGGVTY